MTDALGGIVIPDELVPTLEEIVEPAIDLNKTFGLPSATKWETMHDPNGLVTGWRTVPAVKGEN